MFLWCSYGFPGKWFNIIRAIWGYEARMTQTPEASSDAKFWGSGGFSTPLKIRVLRRLTSGNSGNLTVCYWKWS